MHQLKQQALMMKEALLKGRLDEIGEILDYGFQQKRLMAEGISNPLIEEIYSAAKAAGATGGFMTFYCPGNTKYEVIAALERFGGYVKSYQFVDHGLMTWSV